MSAAEVEQVQPQRESSVTSLSDEFRFFASQTNARVIAGSLAIALIVRLALGGWRGWDLVVVAGFIALQPFIEWMIHVFILHWKPKEIFGRKIDPLLSRKHRAHHRDPRRTDWIFIPYPVLIRLIPISVLLYWLIMPTFRLAMTTAVTGLAILLTYEWTHYLIHSRYKPKSRVYKFIWRAHRLHHFKNENYWFGVTMHAGDLVLGTFPAKDDVETSPTCKTLGVAEQV